MNKVREQYRHIARYYDLAYKVALARGSRRLIEVRPIAADTRVLEIGVGTGFSLPHYPPGLDVTGIDICPEMIAVARRKRLSTARARVELLTMDAHALAFRDRSFDLLLFPHSLGLMQDPGRVLAEVARVARNGAEVRVLHTFEWQVPVLGRVETALYDAFEDRLGWGRPLNLERLTRSFAKWGFGLTETCRHGWKRIAIFRRDEHEPAAGE